MREEEKEEGRKKKEENRPTQNLKTPQLDGWGKRSSIGKSLHYAGNIAFLTGTFSFEGNIAFLKEIILFRREYMAPSHLFPFQAFQ